MHAGDIPDYLVQPSNFLIPYFLGNKLPQTEWLKKRDIQCLPVLEVRSIKSRGWQGGETQLSTASGVLVNVTQTPEGRGQPGLRPWTISALWILPSLPISSYQLEVSQLQTFPRSSHELFWASANQFQMPLSADLCGVKRHHKRAAKMLGAKESLGMR